MNEDEEYGRLEEDTFIEESLTSASWSACVIWSLVFFIGVGTGILLLYICIKYVFTL